MDISFVFMLLGSFLLHGAASRDSVNVSLSVWPPGSNIYLDESVSLQCIVESNHSLDWAYVWIIRRLHPPPIPNPRHLVLGDTYSITVVTRKDEGSYQCQAELREGNITFVEILSQPVVFRVSDRPPPSLTLTPSSRQIFRGERFSVQCPILQASSGWMLRRFPPGSKARSGVYTDQCSPLGGAVSTHRPGMCVFTAARDNGGLYWCEGAEGRSTAVSVTVSYGSIILRTPASPLFSGDSVDLYCRFLTGNNGNIIFFKNGAEIMNFTSSSSDREIKMRIENVTLEDEGFYRCASEDRWMESSEIWLSVRPAQGNITSAGGTAASSGSWIWIIVVCGLLLLLLFPLSLWLFHHYRYQAFCTRSCWPVSKEEPPAVGLPVTKQDVTEVQWDLSWMEMSNLLDKHYTLEHKASF